MKTTVFLIALSFIGIVSVTASSKENTIILDTRSAFRYDRKHLEGAVHLSFTDFTQYD